MFPMHIIRLQTVLVAALWVASCGGQDATNAKKSAPSTSGSESVTSDAVSAYCSAPYCADAQSACQSCDGAEECQYCPYGCSGGFCVAQQCSSYCADAHSACTYCNSGESQCAYCAYGCSGGQCTSAPSCIASGASCGVPGYYGYFGSCCSRYCSAGLCL